MKKNLFFAAIAAMVITSCTTTIKTATTTELPADLLSATVADLDVSSTRISYTMTPSNEVARAGLGNAKRAAIMEALQKYDKDADILVEPEFVVSMKNIKAIIALTSVSALLASCITTTKTAKTAGFDASTYTATVADLDVADQRVTVTLNPAAVA